MTTRPRIPNFAEEATMLAILLCLLLFWGTPDLYDKIVMALDKYTTSTVCK